MSIYEGRAKNHSVNNELENFINKLEKLIAENVDEEVLDHLNRLLEIAAYSKNVLAKLDDVLVPQSVLDNANGNLQNINGNLTNFENNPQIEQLAKANTRADELLINLQRTPQTSTIPNLIDLSEDTSRYPETYRQSISKIISEINKKKIELEEEIKRLSGSIDTQNSNLGDLKSIIDTQKGRLDTAISDFQKQFSEAEDRRRENFDNQTNQINGEFQKLQNNLNAKMNAFSDEKQKAVANALNEYSEKTKKAIDDFNNATESAIAEQENAGKETIGYLTKKREEAAQLLDAIGTIGFTSNYKEIASQEKETANFWRYVAIGFMALGILVVGTIIFHISSDKFDWKVALARVAVTITIFVPAFYAAKESSKHRQREMHNRKMELELASLGPYLELLPDKEKLDLKSKLTEKFFGQPSNPIAEKDVTVSANALFNLVEKIVTNLTKKQ